MIKLAAISLLSLSLGFLMAYGALKTAQQIAFSLVKQQTIIETY